MSAPNIVNVTTINLKNAAANLTTSLADILANAASSNKVLKVNGITVSNTSAANITVDVVLDVASTNYYLAKEVLVYAKTSLVIVSKDSAGLYLEENDKIEALASAATADIIITYEELS